MEIFFRAFYEQIVTFEFKKHHKFCRKENIMILKRFLTVIETLKAKFFSMQIPAPVAFGRTPAGACHGEAVI